MHNIVVFGAGGMLGHALLDVFKDAEVIGLSHIQLDITDKEAVYAKVALLHPSIIINAAAYTDVDGCESNKEKAYRVNGYAVGFLAEAAARIGAVVVHFSTDYIFDGEKVGGYAEDDTPGPLSIYGKSKLLGEVLLREKLEHHYIVRTSWLFGPHGKNFVDTIIRLTAEKEEISVVDDQIGSPTFTYDLAQGIKHLLDSHPSWGAYHLTNAKSCSWYGFAREIVSKNHLKCRIRPITSAQFPRPATRPACSILKNTKGFGLKRPWQDALASYMGGKNQ